MNENLTLPKILIIDDSDDLNITRDMLAGEGFLQIEAETFEAAVSEVSVNKFDLIILSCRTNSEACFKLCRQIKSNPQRKDIPLILVVPSYKKHEIGLGMQAGANDYLLFPFSSDELLMRVHMHLNLKQIKETAEHSARTKALFLANISHEIRTPLNGIVGMTDILRQTELTEEQSEYLDIIRLSGENLLMLVNDVLDFSKIEAGQVTFEHIRFNLFELIEEVKKTFAYKTEQKKLRFIVQLSPEVPENVIGDPFRLKQILINLCSNAIKFTARGFVKIKVSLQAAEKSRVQLFFEVEDSGIGIAEEDQAKLFQLYSQAGASTTRQYGGTGLGLAICRNLVEMMNGKIGVYSEPGRGSNFYFTGQFDLPEKIEPEPEVNLVDVLKESRPLKILLAEDNIINQKVATLNLEKLGHKVILANDGNEALARYYNEIPDAIFMDVQMAGMDGLEATRKIREWEKKRQVENPVPIVAMTAHTLESDKKLILDSGMNDFLYKPFNWNDLVNVLDRIKLMVKDKNKNARIWNSVK